MTALKSVPLEDVLRDVLDGVQIVDGLRLEDLTPQQMALVMIRVQQMTRLKIEDFKELTRALAEAEKNATTTHAAEWLKHEGRAGEERTQRAKQAAADACFKRDVLKGELKACEKALDNLIRDWETTRSINTNQRTHQTATGGWGA